MTIASDRSIGDLLERARNGDRRAVARLITFVENESPRLREVAEALAPHTGRAFVLGLTGPPGVGKSTTTSALVSAYRRRGLRIAVLAIDPSSPFSGGALLGDRIRMQDHAIDDGVFIRSMSSRGHLGGMSWATPQAVRVLDGAGFDVVLIETVGVGQAEVDIAALADTTVVLLAPGMGDAVQASKAGILEIADVFAVNKADRDGTQATVRDLKAMLQLGGRHSEAGAWRPRIVPTVAVRGDGIDELVEAVAAHREWMDTHGELTRRRQARAASEIEAIALAQLRAKIGDVHGVNGLPRLAESVAEGRIDPYAAADELLANVDRAEPDT